MKTPKLRLRGASLSSLCGLVAVFSSSILNLTELSSSTPARSVGKFGSLFSVFLWEFALCPGASQGLSLLAGMQGSWYPARTAHRPSELFLGRAAVCSRRARCRCVAQGCLLGGGTQCFISIGSWRAISLTLTGEV